MRFTVVVLLLAAPYVLADDSKVAAALYERGKERLYKGEYDQAIKDFDESIRLEPNVVPVLFHRGLAWHRKSDCEKAMQDYDTCILLDPKYAIAYNNRANVWTDLKEYEKAIKDFSEAIRLEPKDAIVIGNRGDTLCVLKRWDEAIKDYTEALKLVPRYDRILGLESHFHAARGDAWRCKKEFEKAFTDCNEAVRIDHKSDYALGVRASVYAKVGKYQEALLDFEKGVKLYESMGVQRDYAFFLATCKEAKYRDGTKALKLAKAAIEKAGKYFTWDYKTTLAAALAETGDFDGAVKEQKAALADKFMHADDRKEQEARLKLYEAKKPFRDE